MSGIRRLPLLLLAMLLTAVLPACKDEEFDSASIEVLRPAEYAAETTTPVEYLKCSSQDVSLSAKGDLDTTQVGTHSVEVELTKGRHSRTEEVEIAVKDTTPPSIKLKKGEATVEMGEDIDLSQYVETVSDPVDGDLKIVKDRPKSKGERVGEEVFYDAGWYVVSCDSDLAKPGEHKATVEAQDKHGNKATETIAIKVTDPLDGVKLTPSTTVLEYSKKTTDPVQLVTCSIKDAKVSAKQLELSKVGKVTVEYTIAKGKSTHTQSIDFEVRDTKAPAITLSSDEVAVDHGASFDPYANVTSVTDEVDGELARVEVEPQSNGDGWYTVTGTCDTNNPSKYVLTVVASDRNGNRVTKEYSVLVNEPPTAEPVSGETGSAEVDNARDYVLNTNTHKFHWPSCKELRKMKDSNRQDVHMTRDEVIAMEYSPCGKCNP